MGGNGSHCHEWRRCCYTGRRCLEVIQPQRHRVAAVCLRRPCCTCTLHACFCCVSGAWFVLSHSCACSLTQIVVMFVWGISATSSVEPWDLGVAMITVWPAVLLSVLAGLMWRAKGWHMLPVNRSNWAVSLQAMFCCAGVLVIAWYRVDLCACCTCVGVWLTTTSRAGKWRLCLWDRGATCRCRGCSCRSTCFSLPARCSKPSNLRTGVYGLMHCPCSCMVVHAVACTCRYTATGLLARATRYLRSRQSSPVPVKAGHTDFKRNRTVAAYYMASLLVLVLYVRQSCVCG